MKVCDGGIPLWLMLLAAILLAVHCAGGVGAADSSSGSDAVLSAATSEAAAKRLQAIIANISIPAVPTIGIALAATSKRQGSRIENLTLLKSFGKTFSAIQKDSRFRYAVFVAYDAVDPVFGSEGRRASIAALFHSRYPGDYSWSWVECPYTGRPARSQNDAAMAAYHAGVDYIFRINDDTVLHKRTQSITPLILGLQNMPIPNFGIVGPYCSGGNAEILTHEFVHRSHVDIFGTYYPKPFITWFADEWISRVYEPLHNRVIAAVRVSHSSGTRYKPTKAGENVVWSEVRHGRQLLRSVSSRVLVVPRHAGNSLLSTSMWYFLGFQPYIMPANGVSALSDGVQRYLSSRNWHFPRDISACSSEGGGCLVGEGVPLLLRLLLPGIADLDDGEYVLSCDGNLLPRNDVYWGSNAAVQRGIPFFAQAYFKERRDRDTELPSSWLAVGGRLKEWRRWFGVERGQSPLAALNAVAELLVAKEYNLQRFQGPPGGQSFLRLDWSESDAALFINVAWLALVPPVTVDAVAPTVFHDGPATEAFRRDLASLHRNPEPADELTAGVVVSTLNVHWRPSLYSFEQRSKAPHGNMIGLHLPQQWQAATLDEVAHYLESAEKEFPSEWLNDVKAALQP